MLPFFESPILGIFGIIGSLVKDQWQIHGEK